jgi:hypothetical protein
MMRRRRERSAALTSEALIQRKVFLALFYLRSLVQHYSRTTFTAPHQFEALRMALNDPSMLANELAL